MSSRRAAACVVTGFLGSGKTTLLRELLARDPGRERIAVVVNELGEVGIDGRVLSGFEHVEDVVELSSGCVCCSIDEYRFDLAMDELLRRVDPTLVVLETTGVADPAPVLERLARTGLGVDAVVTVVDALAWSLAWRTSRVARRQVEAADFVVVSKCDIARTEDVDKVRAKLARVSPRAVVLERAGEGGFAGSDLLLATTAAARARGHVGVGAAGAGPAARGPAAVSGQAGDATRVAAGHLDEDRIESFAWRSEAPVGRDAFAVALGELPPEVIRAKGFLRAPGDRGCWLFQLVCGRVELGRLEVAPSVPEGAQGVFLGPGVLALRDRIEARLRHVAG